MEIKTSFENRFSELLGEDYPKFLESIKKPLRKSIRINTLKIKDEKIILEKLKSKGYKLEKVPWAEHSYFLYGEREDLGNLLEHFLGEIYVQEATSLIPPLVMELEGLENATILDMAAAPGSKTSQIVELTKDKCKIIANEIDYKRIAALKINLERLGARNVIITNCDGAKIKGQFDRILVDAPCSGSGVIRKSPQTLKKYNPRRLIGLQNLQWRLLKNAFQIAKSGAIIVYSTCSIDPEEDEFVVLRALKKYKNIKLEKIKLNIKTSHPVKEFEGVKIPKEVYSKVLRIWPQDNDTGGFFVAKFRKI